MENVTGYFKAATPVIKFFNKYFVITVYVSSSFNKMFVNESMWYINVHINV